MFKICVIIIWTGAPNPEAIYWHEMAHCWGWTHVTHSGPRGDEYQAIKPPFWYRLLGTKRGTEVYYEDKTHVRESCGRYEQFGCQWNEDRLMSKGNRHAR